MMSAIVQSNEAAWPVEIARTLAGRRFGLCGFDTREAQRISRILYGTRSLAMPFDERLLAESARVCDSMAIKLAGLSPEGLRAAAASPVPVLVTGTGEALLEGIPAAYGWPRDFMIEPWSDAELLVRFFHLLQSPGGPRGAAALESRTEPLVLLADDDPDTINLLEATLRNDGISCRKTDNGLAALRMARELVPNLLLLDIRMPGMNGFEVLETMRSDSSLQTLPVILLTGCHDPADVRHGSELRADHYLVKPVSPVILLNRVKELLSTRPRNARRWTRSLPGVLGSGGVTKQWMLTGNSTAAERP